MLSHRRSWFVASVVLMLAGCSATGTGRLGGISRSGQKTLATVGDRPVLAATDDSDGDKPAEPAEPPRKRAATADDHARISGRVVDRNGEPVADAAVRLADGGSRSGRELIARTDRSGGFTLAGLDSGATYTVIAEAEGQGGPLRGTVEAEGAETNVEIEVAEPDAAPAKRSRKPRGSRLVPISNRARSQTAEEAQAPADETEPPGLAGSAKTRRARGEPSTSAAPSAWHRVGEAAPRAGGDDADPLPPAAGAEEVEPGPGDDGPNPLPPAIERPTRTRRPAPEPADPAQDPDDEEQPGGMTTAPRAVDPSQPRRDLASRPAPAVEAEPATVASSLPELPSLSEGASPLPPAVPAEQPAVAAAPADPNAEFNPFGPGVAVLPATAPATPTAAPTPAPPAPKTGADYNPFADPFVVQPPDPKPQAVAQAAPRASVATTKGSAFGPDVKPRSSPRPAPAAAPRDPKPAPPAAPPERKLTWGDLPKVVAATRDGAAVAASDEPEINPLPQAAPAVADAAAGVAEAPDPAPAPRPERKADRPGKNPMISLCSFDARQGQLHDFRLPDLEGNPVGLKDLDSDLILLDFWGTWCKPCVDAVPHLVALQKKFGPGRLAVVGIACEEDPPAEQRAKVEAAARKLGINYTVLLSGTDGPCPLRAALKVQNLPTMIVMDRTGKIRWRAEGATPANLDRLDRVVAAATANSARAQTARR